jgi:hypothetical protein
MGNRLLRCTSSTALTIADLEYRAKGWLLDGEMRQLSKQRLAARKFLTDKFLWYLRQQARELCGVHEIRGFVAYLNRAHEDPAGRWGNAQMRRSVRPRTVHAYFVDLRTLFRFLAAEGALEESPLEQLRPPRHGQTRWSRSLRTRVHECGHVLLGVGLGPYMRPLGESGPLVAKNLDNDEGLIWRWETAWFLPANVLRRMGPEDVMNESRLTWDQVRGFALPDPIM